METITIKANKNKANIIKEFLDNQKVKYKSSVAKDETKEDKPYNPEFVKMVLKARQGKSTRINPQNIWESIL